MELGEKIKQARLAAGLSQRQLCGGEITRNMLSLIENGSATPSMKTLQYLASQLGKSVSYFLEEQAITSPNQERIAAARVSFDEGRISEAVELLTDYEAPDPIFDRERDLLWVCCHLSLAETALEENRPLYARELLQKADLPTAYCAEALSRRRLLLLGRIRGQQVCSQLPSLDEELQLRAEDALSQKQHQRAASLLESMERHDTPLWFLLRGKACLAAAQWKHACQCFHLAEADYPKETAPLLEECYRELQDYRMAYEYACRQKQSR